MRPTRSFTTIIQMRCLFLTASLVCWNGFCSTAFAADAAAGKIKVEQACAECHRPSDWSAESAAALEALMKDIVVGKIKHTKRALQLTPQEIENIAAYWTSGRSPARK